MEAQVEAAPSAARRPCSCGFCDGVEVQPPHVDPRTGEQAPAFTVPSRRSRCPVCGGLNEQYRARYVAHVAALVRRLRARRCDVRFLTVALDTDAADAAQVDGWGESYRVVAERMGRVWRRLRRRDAALAFAGVYAARPGDGRAHAHVLLVTRRTVGELVEVVREPGLDVHVKAPAPNESADDFAACCADYAFLNHASSPSARFTASRGHGAGYDSAEAVRLRREAVRGPGGAGGERAAPVCSRARGGSEETKDRAAPASEKPEVVAPPHGPREAVTWGQTGDRAPPVEGDGRVCEGVEGYVRAVRRALMRRVGGDVQLRGGVGRARLLRVVASGHQDAYVRCTVHVEGEPVTRVVGWHAIAARRVPMLRYTHDERGRPMNEREQERTGDERDAVERFDAVARFSTVTVEMPDGRRRVTRTDHVTGEVEVTIKPPRPKSSRFRRW